MMSPHYCHSLLTRHCRDMQAHCKQRVLEILIYRPTLTTPIHHWVDDYFQWMESFFSRKCPQLTEPLPHACSTDLGKPKKNPSRWNLPPVELGKLCDQGTESHGIINARRTSVAALAQITIPFPLLFSTYSMHKQGQNMGRYNLDYSHSIFSQQSPV